ncbi:hypothetical protein KUH03_08835 [Sphingobacterium sp. E70]|uniref:hypothetical protein n=1 Tax=Sphingobacterium sp. E70 TaxID=2853439 RepID=UPI00211C1B89|nr:hypothetical protein [Sphingobacterium sp. E70]ULT26912.1 hypothetical protein KUH03_08835 [Sphingobacterium sp. E70]
MEQLFAEDFSQKIQAANVSTYGRSTVIKSLKNKRRNPELQSEYQDRRKIDRLYDCKNCIKI